MLDDQTLSIILFAEPGPQNTSETIELAHRRASILGIRTLVVATDTGKTARLVRSFFPPEFRVVAVTNPENMTIPVTRLHDYLPRFREHRKSLMESGKTSVQASLSEEDMEDLATDGVTCSRIDWKKLISYTGTGLSDLDRVGVGVRVATTVSVWAYLIGGVKPDEEVISLAGTGFGGGGSDTALVVKSARRWQDWRVVETLARPRSGPPSPGR